MQKIILFLIFVIIATAFARTPALRDTGCALKASLQCNGDVNCIAKVRKECLANKARVSTINTSKNIYGSTILDNSNYENCTRVCITDSNCNCNTLSKTKCSIYSGDAYESCMSVSYDRCHSRCIQSKRCYRMDCKNAGVKRCKKQSRLTCALRFSGEGSETLRANCEQEERACCQKYELATCRKAGRSYNRNVCNNEAQIKCSDLLGSARCKCVSKARKSCITRKVNNYRNNVRKFFGCEQSGKILCSEKKCGAAYERCIKKEQTICEPVCQREARIACRDQTSGPCFDEKYNNCTQIYRDNFCEKKSNLVCESDDYCRIEETTTCKQNPPICVQNPSICDDKNACTIDFCHPEEGCKHTTNTCETGNKCITGTCDNVLGCVYTSKVCDDGKTCTSNKCNSTDGACYFTFDKKINKKCLAGPCKKESDCLAWGASLELEADCKKAICDADLGTCVAIKKESCPTNCLRTCQPSNACETTKCVLNTTTKDYDCVHIDTSSKCNENKKCKTNYCDNVYGCQYKKVVSKECPANPICETNANCVQWGITQKLHENCQQAVCDVESGICKATATDKKCILSKCEEVCKPEHSCETAKCKQDGENAYCVKTPIICDDHKSCTSNTCNNATGCDYKYEVSEKCEPGYECKHTDDCQFLVSKLSLTKKCKKAVCDQSAGSCKVVPIDKDCKIRVGDCEADCVSSSPCETAYCAATEDSSELVCKRRTKDCDDKKECTYDNCDLTNGTCTHTYTVSNVCPKDGQCETDNDCFNYAFDNKLSRQCKKAICDTKLGACRAIPKNRKCTTKIQCETGCKVTNACEVSATCQLSNEGDYVCEKVQNKCDDKKECTFDTCNYKSGQCEHKFITSEKCKAECKFESDCAKWGQDQKLDAQCLIPTCDTATGSCVTKPNPSEKCSDLNKCKETCKSTDPCKISVCSEGEAGYRCKTTDNTCQSSFKCKEGKCIAGKGCEYTYKVSGECPADSECENNLGCIVWGDKLKVSSKCLEAVCDTTYGKCVTQKSKDESCLDTTECDKSCVPKDKCESAVCVKQNGKVECVRTTNTCDDKKICTVDKCNPVDGKCLNEYKVSEKCPTGGECKSNLECKNWFVSQELDESCLTPVCDSDLGSCKAVPNGKKCTPKTCKKACKTESVCDEPSCSYDVNKKVVCEYTRKTCTEKNNKCVKGRCDNVQGCVYEVDKKIQGCETPVCKDKVDCNTWALSQNLNDKCQEAACDPDTTTCKAVLINTELCNPLLKICQKDCQPKTACETAICQVNPTTKKVKCLRTPISCDDKNECTENKCNNKDGCFYPYKKSAKCQQQCRLSLDCAEWAIEKKLSTTCEIAVCDEKTTSCVAIKDTNNQSCKPVKELCDLTCKPYNKCDTVSCDRKAPGSNEISCVHTAMVCNDNKDCTDDSCNKETGCVYTFNKKNGNKCSQYCEKDSECTAWGINNKLADKCELPYCNTYSGSCDRKVGPQTEKCKETNQCETANDCATSKFGSTCCVNNGQKKCCEHKCRTDSDCVPRNDKEWGYCRKNPSGQNECINKPKCEGNEGCDDKNPCTRDICMKDYGFCKNEPRCVDHTECTEDICIPSSDKKTYTCSNPVKSCTNDKTLLDKNFDLLTKEQKTKWLGQCSALTGCVSCVVNAQCDDNKGCTEDSCVNQFCVNKPIHNQWCDPKLEGQKITVQALDQFINKNLKGGDTLPGQRN